MKHDPNINYPYNSPNTLANQRHETANYACKQHLYCIPTRIQTGENVDEITLTVSSDGRHRRKRTNSSHLHTLPLTHSPFPVTRTQPCVSKACPAPLSEPRLPQPLATRLKPFHGFLMGVRQQACASRICPAWSRRPP